MVRPWGSADSASADTGGQLHRQGVEARAREGRRHPHAGGGRALEGVPQGRFPTSSGTRTPRSSANTNATGGRPSRPAGGRAGRPGTTAAARGRRSRLRLAGSGRGPRRACPLPVAEAAPLPVPAQLLHQLVGVLGTAVDLQQERRHTDHRRPHQVRPLHEAVAQPVTDLALEAEPVADPGAVELGGRRGDRRGVVVVSGSEQFPGALVAILLAKHRDPYALRPSILLASPGPRRVSTHTCRWSSSTKLDPHQAVVRQGPAPGAPTRPHFRASLAMCPGLTVLRWSGDRTVRERRRGCPRAL